MPAPEAAWRNARVLGLDTVGRPLRGQAALSPAGRPCLLKAVQREQSVAEIPQTSLIPQTLQAMAEDTEQRQSTERLARRGQAALTREERRKRQRSLDAIDAPSFYELCEVRGAKQLRRDAASILQLNIGLYCNQACSHCHVESSPMRTEMMDRRTAERCLELLRQEEARVSTVDITGGAPELNSEFRFIVEEARGLGLEVIDRCNLTVLLEPDQADLVEFLARHKVRVVASLPCYSTKNVDEQRGGGVFERSIRGLQLLNAAGYGRKGSGLRLDLVYNPNGTFLAPPQSTLEEAYKQELNEAFGITFNSLFCLNNMPIKRFADYLLRRGEMESYMQVQGFLHDTLDPWKIAIGGVSEVLVNNFSPAAAEGVMCRGTVNVGWDGRIFDCDFNQQLDLGMRLPQNLGGSNPTVFSIDSLQELTGARIACDNHCFGCTAGAGSSCQGALS